MKEIKFLKIKIHPAINIKKLWWQLEDRAKLKEMETIISIDLLELLVLLCSIIMQQYTLQCTIHKDSSANLPLPRDQHHISDVSTKRLGGEGGQMSHRHTHPSLGVQTIPTRI